MSVREPVPVPVRPKWAKKPDRTGLSNTNLSVDISTDVHTLECTKYEFNLICLKDIFGNKKFVDKNH